MNKKIWIMFLIILFIPTAFALLWLVSVSGNNFTPSNVPVVKLESSSGDTWTYIKDDEKEFFTDLAQNLVQIERQEFSEDVWTVYKLTLERTFEDAVFNLCLSSDAKNCLAYDMEGKWYRINTDDARVLLVREELEGLYSNSTPPVVSIVVAGKENAVPLKFYEWNYLIADGSFTTLNYSDDNVYASNLTVSSSIGLILSFSNKADWCDVKIFDGDTLVFSGDDATVSAFSYEKDARLRALVTSEWYQNESDLYYGKTVCEFYFDYDVKATAELNKNKYNPGEIAFIKIKNAESDVFEINSTLKTSENLVQRYYQNGMSYVLVPIDIDNKTGSYTVVLQSDNTTISLALDVEERVIEDSKIKVDSGYDAALENFLDEISLDTYESKLFDPLWKDGFLPPVKKYDGEKEVYWVSSPAFAAKQIVSGTPLSSKNTGIHFVKSVELDTLNVWAMTDAVVAFAGNTTAFGNTLVLDHGFGLFSVYGHLAPLSPYKVGDQVYRGQWIACTGDTGMCLAEGELFFAFIQDGVFVNPYTLISEQKSPDDELPTPAPIEF